MLSSWQLVRLSLWHRNSAFSFFRKRYRIFGSKTSRNSFHEAHHAAFNRNQRAALELNQKWRLAVADEFTNGTPGNEFCSTSSMAPGGDRIARYVHRNADVVGHASMISQVVERKTMPPWFAENTTPGHQSVWANDRSLSESDRSDLLACLASSRVEGDSSQSPLPPRFADDWTMGTPDLVIQLPAPVRIKATGTMPYWNSCLIASILMVMRSLARLNSTDSVKHSAVVDRHAVSRG